MPNLINAILNGLRNWLGQVVGKKVDGTHVNVPDVLTGSPDYLPPYPVNQSRNWFPYFSLPYGNQEESLGNRGNLYQDNCTIRSSLPVIEAILNYFIQTNPTNSKTLFLKKYYCNKEGWVKLSVRYSSKMANIQEGIGANIGNVWNSYATHGVIPESVYPDPTTPYSWQDYMQPLPAGLEAYGSYSLTLFKVIWTALQTNGWNAPNLQQIENGLMSSPACIAGKIGNVGVDGIERWQGIKMYEHCRIIGSIDDKNHEIDILDNYPINGLMTRRMAIDFPQPTVILCQVKIL